MQSQNVWMPCSFWLFLLVHLAIGMASPLSAQTRGLFGGGGFEVGNVLLPRGGEAV